MSESKPPRSPDDLAREEEEKQYGLDDPAIREEIDEKYPNRPHNHSRTLPFFDLAKRLFNPLLGIKKSNGNQKISATDQRRLIVKNFIREWRQEVGNDFYPALRLILPDLDRDRGVYGLKETTIGKHLVKLMRIDKNSADAQNLINWKLPGRSMGSTMAGDFAGRCYEVLSKRKVRSATSGMRIGEVNIVLDKLSAAKGEAEQAPLLDVFYSRMSAEEMMWMVRILLRQSLRVGARENTFLELWHPDGPDLYNVSSSMRRVCWELWDPELSLHKEEKGIGLMQCFQPQRAQFQKYKSWDKMLEKMGCSAEHPEFWIEEKLDGERIQMHMQEDEDGKFKFAWWSRKGVDYTYLYGNGFDDNNSALTRHLRNAFHDGVSNIILDGEMITWDPEVGKVVAFGTLKTAALDHQKNPASKGPRPVFRVFDLLLLNDKVLTNYELQERRNALKYAVRGQEHRLEIHPYIIATTSDAIEPELRKIVAEAGEGLVLKNPKSSYSVAGRKDSWMKVKPEYMEEYGESIDCVIIGGYYGSGHRGGTLSSFLCGVRPSQNHIDAGTDPEKCFSFCKVGGGLNGDDYRQINHHIESKLVKWDSRKPPSEYIELGGGERYQYEKPDVWIRPSDSIVICVKAASIVPSDQFAMGWTLRFPRFRRMRLDKAWNDGLDTDGLEALRSKVDEHERQKKMQIEEARSRPRKRVRKERVIAGVDISAPASAQAEFANQSKIFDGLEFCVLTEATKPVVKSKTELERLIKENGGKFTQRPDTESGQIIIGEKRVVKVASLMKSGEATIVRPKWIFDCLAQPEEIRDFLLPFEESHLFFATEEKKDDARDACGKYGDSYVRVADVNELSGLLKEMPDAGDLDSEFDAEEFLTELEDDGHDLVNGLKGWVFRRCRVHFAVEDGVSDLGTLRLRNFVQFGHGEIADDIDQRQITHVVVVADDIGELAARIRTDMSSRARMPRIVTAQWVEDCWTEGTRLDEERYMP